MFINFYIRSRRRYKHKPCFFFSLKEHQNHIKVSSTKILCSESNGSPGWLPLQVKIETKARFLAKRLVEATGDLTNKKGFSYLTFNTLKKFQ